MGRRVLVLVALASAMGLGACGRKSPTTAARPGEQVAQVHAATTWFGSDLRYLLYLPKTYPTAEKLPLVIFLHGAGEKGDDLTLVAVNGIPRRAAAGDDFPFILASPQVERDQWWSAELVLDLLAELESRYPVDPDRVYLTGLSMGGYGTWKVAAAAPERFAAIAPVCGGGDPANAQRLTSLATWAFHGDADSVVHISESRKMVEALEAVEAPVRFTVYPGGSHRDAWEKAYADPEFYTWMLGHRRTADQAG